MKTIHRYLQAMKAGIEQLGSTARMGTFLAIGSAQQAAKSVMRATSQLVQTRDENWSSPAAYGTGPDVGLPRKTGLPVEESSEASTGKGLPMAEPTAPDWREAQVVDLTTPLRLPAATPRTSPGKKLAKEFGLASVVFFPGCSDGLEVTFCAAAADSMTKMASLCGLPSSKLGGGRLALRLLSATEEKLAAFGDQPVVTLAIPSNEVRRGLLVDLPRFWFETVWTSRDCDEGATTPFGRLCAERNRLIEAMTCASKDTYLTRKKEEQRELSEKIGALQRLLVALSAHAEDAQVVKETEELLQKVKKSLSRLESETFNAELSPEEASFPTRYLEDARSFDKGTSSPSKSGVKKIFNKTSTLELAQKVFVNFLWKSGWGTTEMPLKDLLQGEGERWLHTQTLPAQDTPEGRLINQAMLRFLQALSDFLAKDTPIVTDMTSVAEVTSATSDLPVTTVVEATAAETPSPATEPLVQSPPRQRSVSKKWMTRLMPRASSRSRVQVAPSRQGVLAVSPPLPASATSPVSLVSPLPSPADSNTQAAQPVLPVLPVAVAKEPEAPEPAVHISAHIPHLAHIPHTPHVPHISAKLALALFAANFLAALAWGSFVYIKGGKSSPDTAQVEKIMKEHERFKKETQKKLKSLSSQWHSVSEETRGISDSVSDIKGSISSVSDAAKEIKKIVRDNDQQIKRIKSAGVDLPTPVKEVKDLAPESDKKKALMGTGQDTQPSYSPAAGSQSSTNGREVSPPMAVSTPEASSSDAVPSVGSDDEPAEAGEDGGGILAESAPELDQVVAIDDAFAAEDSPELLPLGVDTDPTSPALPAVRTSHPKSGGTDASADAAFGGLVGSVGELKGQMAKATKDFRGLFSHLSSQMAIFAALPTMPPLQGRISSPYGKRLSPTGGESGEFHRGIDIAAPKGTVIFAPADGNVVFAGQKHGFGNCLVLSHGMVETAFGHLYKMLVKSGQRVKRGDPIARVGSTGRSTGPHLHFEVRIEGRSVDPSIFIGKHAQGSGAYFAKSGK